MINKITNIVADFTRWGIVSIQGTDAAKFLQGQCTQDMNKITASRADYASFLTIKGRVLATCIIMQKTPNHYLLLMPQNNIDNFIEKLSKYAIFSKVEITDVSSQYDITALWQTHINTDWDVSAFADDAQQIAIINTPMSFIITNTSTTQKVRDTLHKTHQPQEENIISLTLIQSEIPVIDKDNSEVFTVHDLNLPQLNAVSFNKGCYTGQEIVARTHYKATLKHHMYLLKYTTPIKNHQVFFDANKNEVGRIINIVNRGSDSYALTWLKDDVVKQPSLEDGDSIKYHFEIIPSLR